MTPNLIAIPLTKEQANAPRPNPPSGLYSQDWWNYFDDMACWIATQSERLISGVEDACCRTGLQGVTNREGRNDGRD